MKFFQVVASVVFFSCVSISAAYAQSHTTTQARPNGQRTVTSGGALTSSTTQMRQIGGWEHHLTNGQPNLKHYCWVPMLEAGRQYRRVAPGQSKQKGVIRYPKPSKANVPTQATYKPITRFVPVQHHDGIYTRPRHVATVRPSSKTTMATYRIPQTNARMSGPKTNLAFNSRQTNMQLMNQQVGGGIYVKPRHVPTVRPQLTSTNTNLQLSVPQTGAQLATRQTIARLTNQNVEGQLAAPGTAVELSYDNSHGMIAQKAVFGNVQASRVKGRVVVQPTRAY